jgi:hypothetical protein
MFPADISAGRINDKKIPDLREVWSSVCRCLCGRAGAAPEVEPQKVEYIDEVMYDFRARLRHPSRLRTVAGPHSEAHAEMAGLYPPARVGAGADVDRAVAARAHPEAAGELAERQRERPLDAPDYFSGRLGG